MKVLVTGGAGFIGSHTVDCLVEAGHAVRVLDDLSTGARQNLNALVDFREGDVTDTAAALQATQGCDAVVHLAARVSVPQSMSQPYETYRTNTLGTANMLEAARINGVKRFVLASTCAVYGDSAGIKSEESAIDPVSPYASSKFLAEELGRQYARNFGMGFVALRYFNVYGPRQRSDSPYSGVIAKWMTAIKAGQPCIVFGDGEQTRDFVFVKDVARANVLMATATEVGGGVFNVATGRSVSLNELLKMLGAREVRYEVARAGDVRESRAEIDLLMAANWQVQNSLSEAMMRMVHG